MSGSHRIRMQRILREAEGYLELNMPQNALSMLARIDDAGTFRGQQLYLTGEALRALERFAEALPHYEATLETYPNVPEAQCNFATALAMTSHVAEAIAHYEIALRLKPDFSAARENLARLRSPAPP